MVSVGARRYNVSLKVFEFFNATVERYKSKGPMSNTDAAAVNYLPFAQEEIGMEGGMTGVFTH